MKVAILHDYLNQYGGAERVLEVLLEMFPEADVYTLLYDKEKVQGKFEKNVAGTSVLNIKPIRKKHRLFIPFMPFATKTISQKKEYDLVLSSTSGYAKGFPITGTYHICYCLSPLRYAWEREYLKALPFAPWALSQAIFHPIANMLRKWDKRASQIPNLFIADSEYIAEKVNTYYERECGVLYPPVDTNIFFGETGRKREDFYLMAGRLLYYKGFDIGIKAFNDLGKRLLIVGSGPELENLKQMKKSANIEFITNAGDADLRKFYSRAKAFIFPQIEDFGLTAAEAQTCGTPVIAYDVGGGAEIVEHKKTGILFHEQSPESLKNAIEKFERTSFDERYIKKRAERFSKKAFKENLLKIIYESGVHS